MKDDEIEVQSELVHPPLRGLHWKLGATMAGLALFDGYDTFNPAYVIQCVRDPWGLSLRQAGMLVSSGLIGFSLGAAVHAMFADQFGRRITLIGGLWITTLFSALTASFADSFESFFLLRVIAGVGLGVLLRLSTTYINELEPRRLANQFALCGAVLGWAAGGAMAGAVGCL